MRALTILLIATMIFDFRFELGAASISVFEIVAGVGIGAVVLSVLARWRGPERTRAWFGGGTPGVVLAYLTLATLSALAAAAMQSLDGLYALRDMVAGITLGTIVLMRGGGKTACADIDWTVAVAVAFAGALALLQAAFGWPYLQPLHEHAYFKHAVGGIELVQHPAVGTVAHPNALAVLIGPLVVMSTGHAASWKGSRSGRLTLWSLLAIAASGLIATQAKMAVLIFAVAAIVTAWLVLRRAPYRTTAGRWALTTAVLVFTATIISVIAFGSALPEFLSPATLIERALLNGTAIDALAQSPQRIAFGGCVQAVLEATPPGLGVHNEYLSQCIKFGIPSALLFCACIYSSLRLRASTGWRLAPALIATSVVLLVEGAAGVQHQAMVLFLWACAIVGRDHLVGSGDP